MFARSRGGAETIVRDANVIRNVCKKLVGTALAARSSHKFFVLPRGPAAPRENCSGSNITDADARVLFHRHSHFPASFAAPARKVLRVT